MHTVTSVPTDRVGPRVHKAGPSPLAVRQAELELLSPNQS
jgi:hypothetical protein